jgi:hypothetical protein
MMPLSRSTPPRSATTSSARGSFCITSARQQAWSEILTLGLQPGDSIETATRGSRLRASVIQVQVGRVGTDARDLAGWRNRLRLEDRRSMASRAR